LEGAVRRTTAGLEMMKEAVRAAGGLLFRRGPGGTVEVVLVHRPAYDDWTFPKGKLDDGETEADAAVREVEEETGLRARLGRELTTTSYHDSRGRPKTVRYWEMTPVAGVLRPAHEIDDARWVPVDEAAHMLTYARDRDLLARVTPTE
jgi:8-oxo-dGTP pyrophosphatase MutT (NUDIX family)